MNLFLIAQGAAGRRRDRLAAYLSRLPQEPSLLTPVVVIAECSWRLPDTLAAPAVRTFQLGDFLRAEGVADPSLIGLKLGTASESWLIVDFGAHEQAVATGFIRDLAVFNFHFKDLREKNLVLLMPRLHLGHMGRYANSAFNSIAATPGPNGRSARYRRLLLSTLQEETNPLLATIAWSVLKADQLTRYFHERLIRTKAR